MKKFLAGTTALVAAAVVAGQAQAADPIKLSVGGWMVQGVAVTDVDDKSTTDDTYTNLREFSDTELLFSGSTKLDNGLTVAVGIQTENDRNSSGQDDVTLAVSSDTMGTLTLGATKSATWNHRNSAYASTEVGFGTNIDSTGYALPSSMGDNAANGLALDNSAVGANDGQGVKYASPSFGGFSVALSAQTNSASGNSGAIAEKTSTGDITNYAYSAGYSGEFSGVSVGANIGRNIGDVAAAKTQVDTVYGLQVGMAGFTVAGGYKSMKNLAGVENQDAKYWDAGVSYATGPYAVSLGYSETSADDAANSANEDSINIFSVSGSYDLGAGVSLLGTVSTQEFTSDANVLADEADAWMVAAGLSVSF